MRYFFLQTLPFSLRGFEIQQIIRSETCLSIRACPTNSTAVCPSCQQESHRVHSYYTRSPSDLPVSGQCVQLVLRVRRFRCQNQACQQQTFAERLPDIAVSARQTTRLGNILESIAVVLSGQAGARLTEQLGMPVSADSLLRRAKKTASTSLPTPRILAVDDFAFRRGRTYGTLLLDWESRHPVDLLVDRSAEAFACWLREHPGVQVIIRDRSTEYLRGASEGAPDAQQVLDRWHVLKNLREAIERLLNRTQMQPNAQGGMPSRQKRTRSEQARSEGSRLRRLAQYHQVMELYKQGGSIVGIARQLGISRQTVRKCLQAKSFPEWKKAPYTKSAIDPYRPYLRERWQQGHHSTNVLWQELQARGFSGSRMMVYRWVQLQKEAGTATPDHSSTSVKATKESIAPRKLAWLLLLDPARLDQQEQQTLSSLRQESILNVTYELAQQFMTMVKQRNAQPLNAWLLACQTSGISELDNFAKGLQKERSALQAALALPYSNGPIEGKINKLKYIKRAMYGRGGFPLLRQKVLKAA